MVLKRHTPLNANQLTVLQYLSEGVSKIEAYQRGYPHVQRYKPETIIKKTEEFFNTKRIQYYMTKDLPSRDDVAKLEGRGAKGGYYPALVIECYEYFSIPPVSVKSLVDEHTGEITLETTVNNLPTKAGFACQVGILQNTLARYAAAVNDDGTKKYAEFSIAWASAQDSQENILVHNTLNGHYNAGFAKFVAQNLLQWRESKDLKVISESTEKIINITVDMTPEQAERIYMEQMKTLPSPK